MCSAFQTIETFSGIWLLFHKFSSSLLNPARFYTKVTLCKWQSGTPKEGSPSHCSLQDKTRSLVWQVPENLHWLKSNPQVL